MKKLTMISLIIACASATLNAATPAEEVKALQEVITSNSVDRTTRCKYYKAWYNELCTKEELKAVLERNIAAHRRWMELFPESFNPHAGLGKTLASVGRWKEARPELEKALSAPEGKLAQNLRGEVMWELANCLWAAGDKAGAKKILADIANMDWKGWHSRILGRAQYLHRDFTDPDAALDAFKLPHSRDGRPFPTPQEAKYGEGRVSLENVEVVFGRNGAGSEDPIVRLLKRKLTRFGSKFAPGGTKVVIEISFGAPVDKPQGYALDVAKGKVSIKACDRLGAIWGVVSFIQCIDRGGLTISECAIRDWPKCERRGVIDYWNKDFLEFALFNKMSSLTIRMDGDYIPSPLDRERYRIWSQRCREFGIELYHGSSDIAMSPILPLSSPRTWKLHYGWTRFLASVGMGFSFHLDDARFPMHPADLEAAGTAANLDAKYMTRLYLETKKDYPDFKLLFCPPFYWGPDGGVNYPEPRDPYLKSLGTDLDPGIDVYWTGPRVKSGGMSDEKTDWYAGLIGRKPVIFHNGNCRGLHNYIQYGADITGYKKSHSTNLFEKVAAFHQNMSRFQESSEVGSCMDWCWNPGAHDPETAVRRSDEQLEGPGVYEALHEATPSLAYFDKYTYGTPRSELFAEDQADLDKRVADAEAAWNKVLSVAQNKGLFVEDFNRCGLAWAKQLAGYRRNPPKWLLDKRDAEMANTSFAKNEVGHDEANGDEFFPAEMLAGGCYVKNISDWTKRGKRDTKYLGPQTELFGRFQCQQFPPEKPFKLVIMGMAFNDPKPILEVEVNGRVLWRGEAFIRYYFKPLEVEIPVDAMQRANVFRIKNVGPAAESERCAIIHYAVIRK